MFPLFFEKLKEVSKERKNFLKNKRKLKNFVEFLVQLYYNFNNWVRREAFWNRIVYFGFQ